MATPRNHADAVGLAPDSLRDALKKSRTRRDAPRTRCGLGRKMSGGWVTAPLKGAVKPLSPPAPVAGTTSS